jgi:hypothetical protein
MEPWPMKRVDPVQVAPMLPPTVATSATWPPSSFEESLDEPEPS